MKNNRFFLAEIALILSTAFATPAMAGTNFFKKDCTDQSTTVCQLASEKLSKDKLTFLVHGGNRKLQMAAYRVAQRLDDEGVPIAFLLAPASGKTLTVMQVDFYTKGGTQYGLVAYDNEHNTIANTELGLYEQAIKAYEEDFGKIPKLNK